jgi:tetratricopeptide (TPR) repeat protein
MSVSKGWLGHAVCVCFALWCCSVVQAQDSGLADAGKAFHAGRWVEAERLLRDYLAGQEDSADAHYLLASTLFHEDRPAESLAEYTRAARLRRPGADDLKTVALDYVLAHDYRDADKWMTEAVRLGPEDGEAWYALGRIRYSEEKFDAATEAFQEALKRMPASVKTENNLGLAYEGLDQPEKAMAAYRQAIEWQKNDLQPSEQPYINLGKLLIEKDHAEEALPYLLRAEELSPGNEQTHVVIGKLYQGQGDLKKAQDELRQAVAIAPQDAATHFLLGRIYRSEGLASEADTEFALVAQIYKAQAAKP